MVKAARAYLTIGDRDAASETCRRGLAAHPGNRELSEILGRLQPARRARDRGERDPRRSSPSSPGLPSSAE